MYRPGEFPEVEPGRHPGWPTVLGPLMAPVGRVELRPPRLRDARQWSAIRLRDRENLEPWEPGTAQDWLDRNAVLAWPGQWFALRSLARRGVALPFVITVDGVFAGQITVGNVIRGALCSAWLGYWVDSDKNRGGVATAAAALLIDHCFTAVGLHRLEATVQPDNAGSLRVLDKLGFRHEGIYRRYLRISGNWHDHLCFALTSEDIGDGVARRIQRAGLVW